MKNEELNNRIIFRFWFPLALTWIIMAFEGPFVAAIIARLPDAKYNLAAFGVAFSFAVLIESPIIMLMTASTALANNKKNYIKLLRFTQILNGIITIIFILVLIPGVFKFITQNLMGLETKMTTLTYRGLFILLPWPAAIGIRRFYQGLLIRNNQTRQVTYGTIIRLLFMVTTAIILYLHQIEGIILGAFALSIGVMGEAIAIWLMSRNIIKKKKSYQQSDQLDSYLTFKCIIRFYYPLAITSFISIGIHPTVIFFLGKSKMALESLAVLPVINAFVFLFRSIALSYQEVGIALNFNSYTRYKKISVFAGNLGLVLYFLIAIIVFSPLARVWFHQISGLSMELTTFSILPVRIMALMPLLSTWLSFQRSILVVSKKTNIITRAAAIEIIILIAVLIITVSMANVIGAVGAALAYIIGKLASNLYLWPHQRRFKNKFRTGP